MAVRFIDRMMFPVVLTVSALTAFLLSAAPVAYGAQVSPAERARAAAVYDMPASAADTIPEVDTVYALDELMVVATRTSQEIVPVQMLSGEKLRTLGTHSIADAIRYFSGVQIKDYGGIGGGQQGKCPWLGGPSAWGGWWAGGDPTRGGGGGWGRRPPGWSDPACR